MDYNISLVNGIIGTGSLITMVLVLAYIYKLKEAILQHGDRRLRGKSLLILAW